MSLPVSFFYPVRPGDEIVNVNFLYNDIVHVLTNKKEKKKKQKKTVKQSLNSPQ